jgi:8-amino-7-oxononanoate synthase
MKDLAADLERRARLHLYRTRRVVDGPQGPEPVVDGRRMVAFCSNDYLGLAGDPRVAEALARGARRYGAGSGAAHLVVGHAAPHHALEEELAEFLGRPRALLFSTGYMANLGAIGALVGRGDTVLEDRLNHASLIDGATLSRARLRRYPHCDAAAVGRQLAEASGEVLVATDGVFSMDGDLAPLPGLAGACKAGGAWLLVDDAHALGVVGPGGRGTTARFGLGPDQVPILVGTLGKAFGTAGAFVAGSDELIETLIQHARPYLYTTAAPPAVADATRAALRIAAEEEWRRERLRALVARFRHEAQAQGLPLADSETPIQPILLGSAARSLQWAEALERAGVLVTPIRPPTVPEGHARLRVTFSARHTDAHLDRLLEALRALQRREEAA